MYRKHSSKKYGNCFNKAIVSLTVLAMMVCSTFLGTGTVAFAASYSGSGTKSDPFLVQTAEQLDGMRDNLSAHYKLANTIDMSSVKKFTPIGYQGDKFKGSFTCDTNEDGTPKYAIKNLTVYIDAGEKYGHKIGKADSYVDYAEGKNKWQAGLFGYTDGATLQNIAIINANVTNTVVGQNGMNSDWSINPGQNSNDQSTGILIGSAENTTVSGCSASGSVNSKSNGTGGLLGYIVNCTVTNSYCTANVTNSGYWCTGGLVGTVQDSSITSCFASGNVQGGPTEATTGGLVGQVSETSSTTVISSCYSTGSVSPDNNGFSIFGFRMGYEDYTPSWAMNCYTTGSVSGYSSFVNSGMTLEAQNLFVLSGVTGRQEGFTPASAADIKAKLSGVADFDISGDLPTLKNVHIIKDENAYQPGAVTETPSSSGGSAAANTTSGAAASSEEVVLSEEDINKLNEKMLALPDEDSISLDDLDNMKEIKSEYESLSDEQKELISPDALKQYNVAYENIVRLVMADITKRVGKLPELKKLKASDYDEVMELYDNYLFIGDNAEYMEEDIKNKLLDSVEQVKKLKEEGGDASGSISAVEWILIGVLSLFILCVLALDTVWTCIIVKKYKKLKKDDIDDTYNGDEQVEL